MPMTPTTGYRFKLPHKVPGYVNPCATNSFGVEPYGIYPKGGTVKTGKAVVRIVIYNHLRDSRTIANEVATAITNHLNNGGAYAGPEVIGINWSFCDLINRGAHIEKISEWLK